MRNAVAPSGHAHSANSDGSAVQTVAVEDIGAEFARHYVYGGDGREKTRQAVEACPPGRANRSTDRWQG